MLLPRDIAVLALGGLVTLAACTDHAVTGAHPVWNAVPAAALGPGVTRVVDTAAIPSGLVAVGSDTTNGEQVPAIWRSPNGISWQRLRTTPKSVYGLVSELTTVAAEPDGRAAAIGQMVGGTHGNPRVGSWYLEGDDLVEVTASVELYGGPRQGSVNEMAAGPDGFVVVGSRTDRNERTGAAVWTSPDAHEEFTILDTDPALESAPGELVRALGAAGNSTGYLAVGDRTVDTRIDADAGLWTSPTGRAWTRVPASEAVLGGPGDQSAQLATAWGNGWAAAGVETIDGRTGVVVWATRDGARWFRTRVDAMGTDSDSLSQVTSLVTANGELVIGARLGHRFVAASSPDGVTWTAITLPVTTTDDPHALLLLAPVDGKLVAGATTVDGTRLWWTLAPNG